MKEKILGTLKIMGFKVEDIDGHGYSFQYEGKYFLYLYSDDDNEFLNIALPAVLDFDNETGTSFHQLMDTINSNLKYIKAYKCGDSMWLFYERELTGSEDLEEVLTRMILHLDTAINFLHQTTAGSDDNGEQENDN